MALSPNYGWTEPDNTGLVKNGAQDMRTLGDAIDTSVWNIGFGQAGKNKIINGNFAINQRSFTSTTSSLAYTFDRWQTATSGGTATYSAQTFTPGAAPVAGYEGRNFTRIVTTGQSGSTNFTGFQQKIEDVRSLAGQSATISFWAKAASGTPKISIVTEQSFGTGGSPSSVVTTLVGEVTLSTSWVRYSVTGTVPSISGKTIGTNNDSALVVELYVSVGSGLTAYGTQGLQTNTFDIWGVQLERGSKATPFQTASGGSPQAELAMCQRYYEVQDWSINSYRPAVVWLANSSPNMWTPFMVQKRVAPTISFTGNPSFRYISNNGVATGQTLAASGAISTQGASLTTVATFALVGAGWIDGGGSSGFSVNVSAEL